VEPTQLFSSLGHLERSLPSYAAQMLASNTQCSYGFHVPRSPRRSLLVGLAALGMMFVIRQFVGVHEAESSPSAPAVAFVSGVPKRTLLNKRGTEGSEVAMHGVRRKNIGRTKKTHIRNSDRMVFEQQLHMMEPLHRLKINVMPNLESWSQTLKLSFAEGEDEVVTEQEVMDFFTTEDYAPEAVIVGYKLPHDEQSHAYVHFSTNAACKQARKEKKGQAVPSVSEMTIVFTEENKWIRMRDGVRLAGFKPELGWGRDMKAYGGGKHDYAASRYDIPDFGSRDNWFYPEY